MNLKNAKSLSAALILSLAALSTAHAAGTRIVDLPAITVQPDAALRAELASHAPTVAHIVDLPAVTVRPDAALAAELSASESLVARIVDLPAVTVRPTIEQLAERAAIVAAAQAQALTAQLAATLMAETLAVAQP
jgi:parvulin-like peptidyl-prolyl isomerase